MRNFKNYYQLSDHVPTRKSVMQWVKIFSATGSALKRKPAVKLYSVRMPENIQAVKESVMKSPKRSTLTHALSLKLSD